MDNDAVIDREVLDRLIGRPLTRPRLRILGRPVELDLTSGSFIIAVLPWPSCENHRTPLITPPQCWGLVPGALGCNGVGARLSEVQKNTKNGLQTVGLAAVSDEALGEIWVHHNWRCLPSNDTEFVRALGIPTFSVYELIYERRLLLVVRDGSVRGARSARHVRDALDDVNWARDLIG